MSRPISAKPGTCTERCGVNPTGISGKVRAQYPGRPLSPLLSNILLTALDRELERRGHAFCRYADDCNIYVGSERAGTGLLQNLTTFLEQRLKLKVNVAKSAVAHPWERKFLGYSMTWHMAPRLRIAPASYQRAGAARARSAQECDGT